MTRWPRAGFVSVARVRRLLAAGVAAVALGLTAGACSTFDPNAATVNGTEIKRRDFEDDLQDLRDNEAFVNNAASPVRGELVDSVSTDFAARELSSRILFTLVHQELEQRRLSVDPAVRDVAL